MEPMQEHTIRAFKPDLLGRAPTVPVALPRRPGTPIGLAGTPAANFLLAALPPEDAQRLWPHLECVHLAKGEVVYADGHAPSHAYFPTTAVIALQCVLSDGRTGDFAVIGHEGVAGSPLFTGGDLSLVRAEVRCTGHAFRLRTTVLAAAATQPPLSRLLVRHAQTLIAQAAQTSLCARQHSISEQLCELLLATADRLPTKEISMTHQAIANALGVRREGVTESAHRLQGDGCIRYARGHIEILDRAGLEQHACECYGVSRRLYDSLVPRPLRPPLAPAIRAASTLQRRGTHVT